MFIDSGSLSSGIVDIGIDIDDEYDEDRLVGRADLDPVGDDIEVGEKNNPLCASRIGEDDGDEVVEV